MIINPMNNNLRENNYKNDFDTLKMRIDFLLKSVTEMSSMINKKDIEMVKKMDEIYRQVEEINREYDLLVENLNKVDIGES
ncbi:MAG TPA: hypothetical protein VN704_07460 [Verrucomicrobiae bacterium]|nr:hypothetical protein [Verrucomicrobiae bacterium]